MTESASCQPDLCNCRPGMTKTCGASWDSSCGYEKNSIYNCEGNEGSKPTLDKDCKPNNCIDQPDNGAIWKIEPCKCPAGTGTLCGHDFFDVCGYDPETIYQCSGEGATPEPSEKCPKTCYHQFPTNETTCINGPCDCPEIGGPADLCGSTFPDCGYDQNALYHCEKSGFKPTLKEKCSDTGKECATSGPNANSCQAQVCNCREGVLKQCGSDFPDSCKFPPNTLYSCENPSKPRPTEECEGACIVDPEGHCFIDPCVCKANVAEMCGSEFPSSCGFDSEAVYSCADPKKPTKETDCVPNKCVTTPGAHCYIDPCACQAGSTVVCGSSFPDECHFDKESLYQCDGVSNPTLIEGCKPGTCNTEDNTGVCKDDDCLCKDGLMTACGSYFPPTCGYSQDPKQILRCSGKGAKPVPALNCTTECEINVQDVSAQCKRDQCACTSDLSGNKVCASQFPGECGYSDEKLYYCGTTGDLPSEVQDCKAPSVCDVNLNVGTCITPVDPYKCPVGVKTICGSSFPTPCGLKNQMVYNCKDREGLDPIEVTSCDPQACIPGNTTATCEPDPCLCTESKGAFCGSQRPECGLDPDTLYVCSGPGVYPQDVSKCETGACDPTTSSCKIDPCVCQGKKPTCEADFDSSCGFDPNTLYNCPNVRSKPAPSTECTAGCVMGAGACSPDPCKCSTAELRCGTTFPWTCDLNRDTLFECTGEGADPIPKEKCIVGGCVKGTTQCVPDPCKCRTASTTCGSDYIGSCNLDKDTIYTCSGSGATPQPGEKCGSNLCSVANGTAICKLDCRCKTTGDICGVDFPSGCNLLPDTLYTCGTVGATPTAKQVCKPGACKTGTHECYVDPCACKVIGQVCGKAICSKLAPDTSYICGSVEGPPILNSNMVCMPGACHGGKCDAEDCVCPDNEPFCGGELNCPGLDKDLYYSCTKGKKPFPFGKCNHGRPTRGDCLCNGQYPICSTYFPFECGYDQSQVMTCAGEGAKPQTSVQCGVGRCTNQIKCDKSCTCPSNSAMCGKQFDPSCHCEPGTIYTCFGTGATPVAGKKCASADLCNANGGVGRCLGECQCKDVDPEMYHTLQSSEWSR
ncbi:hypothetical protein BGX26_012594 [Mortierella sp. AD094]|nr:hypothetical protein BGX26_012594 [Mortierella sp. AD094]